MRFTHFIVVAALAFAAGCASSGSSSADGYEPSGADLRQEAVLLDDSAPIAASGATLRVNGLSCPKCASNVDLTLADVPGVSGVEKVDLSAGEVRLAFGGGEHPSPATLARAVKRAGYTLVAIRTH